MPFDFSFETREEARKINEEVKQYWKYYGTAKWLKRNRFIAWRTNSKSVVKNLLEGKYEDIAEIEIDSPAKP